MKNLKSFNVLFCLSALFFGLLFHSCEEEGTEDLKNGSSDSDFVAEFNYHLYGSGTSYDPNNKTFSYKIYLKNQGNIGIVLDMFNGSANQDDIFQLGYYSFDNFKSYSVSFQKNEFRFGEGKLGHEIAPGGLLVIEVKGIVNSSYDNEPNAILLQNLHVYASRYEVFDEMINHILID